jgi:hypothetical protein
MTAFLLRLFGFLQQAHAQGNGPVFQGPSNPLTAGFEAVNGRITGLFQGELREVILRVLAVVLDVIAFVAVIIIVIAGVRLIVSQGEDDAVDKSKKTILYVVIGLIIILLSRLIVSFVLNIITTSI